MSAVKPIPQPDVDHDSHRLRLIEEVRKSLDGPDEARRALLKKHRWIPYTRAVEVLADLESLLDHPRVNRPPCRLILGATHNGKTDIMRQFEKIHKRTERPDGDGMAIPVLYVISPSKPDENRLYENILRNLGAPIRLSARANQSFSQVLRVAKDVGLKVLLLDEIHNVLAGGKIKQKEFLYTLKILSGELQIPIVCAGTMAAFHTIQTEPEVANRFEAISLPPWEMGNEYLNLLASFEVLLPLQRPSMLHEERLATKILALSEGHIGEIAKLLEKSGELAINSKREKIDAQIIDASGYRSPTERRKVPDGLE